MKKTDREYAIGRSRALQCRSTAEDQRRISRRRIYTTHYMHDKKEEGLLDFLFPSNSAP
jgi:hypothetical protein